jgi:hypothetical protein
MRPSLLILASAALLLSAGMAQAAPRDRGMNRMSAPPVEIVTPPTESSVPPPVNPGMLQGPAEFGTPALNSGAIAPLNQQSTTNQPNYGALPGNPGSATYDPNAALPSLDNPGSAMAPLPGTTGAGFNNPSTSTNNGN